MNVWPISDLHLELGDAYPYPCPADADVCVIAGDLHSPLTESLRWAAENVVPEMPVVVVAGNHDFYRTCMREELDAARKFASGNADLHFLEDDLVVIGGTRFVGATLWTDYSLFGNRDEAMRLAAHRMKDHDAIKWQRMPPRDFRPSDALSIHEASRAFLYDAMRIPFDGPTVVVTHHGPHPNSVHPKFREDLLTAAFTSDLTGEIEFGRPDLWIHGHTHSSHDYVVGETRVVCNPAGYRHENPGFKPYLVVPAARPPEPAVSP